MFTLRQRAGVRRHPDLNQLRQIRNFIALIKVVVRHVGGTLTSNQLLILAAVWEADVKGNSLTVSDVANLCDVPTSTASSTLARLGDLPANGMGLITLESDRLDRRKKFIRPSKQLMSLVQTIVKEYAADMGTTNRAVRRRKKQ